MKKKKRVLNIVFVYLYLMYIGATFPVKAQSNYKVKLTGIVYDTVTRKGNVTPSLHLACLEKPTCKNHKS